MRATILFAASVAVLAPSTLLAQRWTPEQQGVIDHTNRCWDAWAGEDFAAIQQICNDHPQATGWWLAEAVPFSGWLQEHGKRWTDAYWPRVEHVYHEIRPLSVQVFGDIALYHFWETWQEVMDGELVARNSRQLAIWQRTGSGWRWLGGMAAPESN